MSEHENDGAAYNVCAPTEQPAHKPLANKTKRRKTIKSLTTIEQFQLSC